MQDLIFAGPQVEGCARIQVQNELLDGQLMPSEQEIIIEISIIKQYHLECVLI